MKFLLLTFLISITISQSIAQEPLQLTEFKEATIESEENVEQANIVITTKKTTHLKNYGKSMAQYIDETRNIKMLNRVEKSRKHTIVDEDYMITIDLDKMKGRKMPNMAKEFLGNMNNADISKLGKEMMGALNADSKPDGTMKIANLTCNRYVITANMMGIETKSIECKYKGYNLYEESNSMGVKTIKKVTSFKEGDPGPASAWKPEPGVDLEEIKW